MLYRFLILSIFTLASLALQARRSASLELVARVYPQVSVNVTRATGEREGLRYHKLIRSNMPHYAYSVRVGSLLLKKSRYRQLIVEAK